MACMLLVDTYMKHSGNRDFQIDLTPTVPMNRTVPLTNPQKRTGMGSLFRSRWLGGVFMYPLLMEFHSFCQVFCFLLSVILSDGKPFLFIGAFGICIKQFLITLAMFSRWSVFLFPPFTLIEGLCGSWVTHIAISMCVISDLTSAGKSRSFYIAIFTFVSGFGSSVGIFVSGYVVTLLGHEFSMAVSFGMALAAFVCICFIPESISNSQKQQKKFSCCGNCRKILQFYTKDDDDHPGSFRWKFVIAVMAFIFIKLAKLGASSMEAYYLLGSPYCLTPEKIGTFETAKSGFSELFILVGIKAMHQCFEDESIALLSNLSSIAQFLLFGIGSTELYLEVGRLHMSIIIKQTHEFTEI